MSVSSVQPVTDVLRYGQRIEQRALLKQHADVGAQREQVALGHGVDAMSVDIDGSAIGTIEPENQFEQD